MRDRARWAEAARNDPEKLALDEFLAFTHPESSHRALLQMVEDLFEKFGKITCMSRNHFFFFFSYHTNRVYNVLCNIYIIAVVSLSSCNSTVILVILK